MNEQEAFKFVKKLYIAEIILFLISAVINILAINNIVDGTIAKVIFVVTLIVYMIIGRIKEKHEDSKKTRNIYMLTVLFFMIYFITYCFIIFFK